jgi:hypothetical protein
MWRVFIGAALVVAGIAAFIEAHAHKPVAAQVLPGDAIQKSEIRRELAEQGVVPKASGLDPTAYDLLRIGAWALVIFGGALMVMGFIRYWRAQTPGPS